MTYRSDWNRCTFYNRLSDACYDSNRKVFKSKIGADLYIGNQSMLGTSSQWAPKFGTQFLYDQGNSGNVATARSNFVGRHKVPPADYEGWALSFWLYIPSTASTSTFNIFTICYAGESGSQQASTIYIYSASRRPTIYSYDRNGSTYVFYRAYSTWATNSWQHLTVQYNGYGPRTFSCWNNGTFETTSSAHSSSYYPFLNSVETGCFLGFAANRQGMNAGMQDFCMWSYPKYTIGSSYTPLSEPYDPDTVENITSNSVNSSQTINKSLRR